MQNSSFKFLLWMRGDFEWEDACQMAGKLTSVVWVFLWIRLPFWCSKFSIWYFKTLHYSGTIPLDNFCSSYFNSNGHCSSYIVVLDKNLRVDAHAQTFIHEFLIYLQQVVKARPLLTVLSWWTELVRIYMMWFWSF